MKNFWFATVTGIAVLLLGNNLFAASPDSFQQYEMQRQDINRSAMLVLGSWAVGNTLAMPTCISTPSSNRSLPGVPDWEWCSGSEVLMSVY